MPSRAIMHLHPDIREKCGQFLDLCRAQSIDILITCTYRSNEEQAVLYAQGRTAPGKIVTWAKPGESKHNLVDGQGRPAAKAFDVVPLRLGKPVWDDTDKIWMDVGAIGESLGLEWAGHWPQGKREFPHFQI
jgi:peptidoglycan L-alanyl-D-glutamate endopeptidase CwlK